MTKTLNIIKFVLMILVGFAIIGGSLFFLMKIGVMKTPAFAAKLPMVGRMLPAPVPSTAPVAGSDDATTEGGQQTRQEMQDQQTRIAELEKNLKQSQDSESQLKSEVARLNGQILELKSGQSGKNAAYQDLADYFSSMKVKDAADILSRLKDEDIIGILTAMPKDAAAEVLQNMARDKAAGLTQKMLVVGNSP